METVRLIYASLAVSSDLTDDIAQIGAQSAINNKSRGITGLLCFSGGAYLQVLEGTGPVLNKLYGTIINDPRHTAVQLLSYVPVERRLFPTWSMHAVNWDERCPASRRAFLLGQFGQTAFKPSEMSARRALNFLEVVAAIELRQELKAVRSGQFV